MATSRLKQLLAGGQDMVMAVWITAMVFIMVLPIPPFLLDILFVVSISISILLLILGFYAEKPLDFSVFPSLLLFSTLLRLGLNIASTRVILLHGSEGEAAAGEVIRAFGYFVVGGNYVVGLIVFSILIIINFVVITKGAGRIAEVAARFTLDAMPGKQLAVDADLNAGAITDKEAKKRREEIASEADFYGAMDGASKFVRGDAIAGILVTIINIIGGFVIGVADGMSLSEAIKVYTILTVGDGLVSQIPALIVSISAGVIVTKVSRKSKISADIIAQTMKDWRPLGIAAIVLLVMGLVPGFPLFPFLLLAGILAFTAKQLRKKERDKAADESVSMQSAPQEKVEKTFEGIPPLDALEVEVGYDLVSLVDQHAGGDFPARVVALRRQFASEMGVTVPPVHIRDNLKLKPNEYRIYLKGAVVGRGELLPHHVLALDPGMTTRKIDGIPTKDPTFGLSALWISDNQREQAMVAGYTVVDLSSVMATHLLEIVRRNLSELFGRQNLQALIEQVKQTHPKVVSDLIPELLSFGTILKVVQNLLRERVTIRDMVTILESLADHASHTKDATELTEYARMALGRVIAQQYVASDQSLYTITLDRTVEEQLMKSISATTTGPRMAITPDFAKRLLEQIGSEAKQHLENNCPPVLLTSQQLRPHLNQLIERFIPNLAVLSHSEVAGHVPVKPLGMIRIGAAA